MPQLATRSLLSAIVLLTLAVAPHPATAQTFSVLHTFTDGADGAYPFATMIMDPGGNLYGTAAAGGTGLCSFSAPGCGTIFQLKKHNTSWLFNPLYSFQGGMDGEAPVRPLTRGPNGTYYGTTLGGGEGACNYAGVPGCGTVFDAGPNPNPPRTPLLTFREDVLYRFTGGSDGGEAWSTVIFDQAGNIYGTTYIGGEGDAGTVFELSPTGGGAYTETVLYSFCSQTDCADGKKPWDGVVFDTAGNLYGTTVIGGAYGYGAVFELSPTGGGTYTETVLYSFSGGADGSGPSAGVTMDSVGNIYGNTAEGGSGGGGTVYELTPNRGNWNFNLLYSVPRNGDAFDRVTLDSNGNLYETLQSGGAFGYGQVLELVRSGSNWTYIDLHDFTNGSDSAYPFGGVVLDHSGNLFGTCDGGGAGGSGGWGVVWEIMP